MYLLAALGLKMQAPGTSHQSQEHDAHASVSSTGNWQPASDNLLRRAANAAFTFVMLNTAALVAFGYFVGRKRGVWVK
jgi:hypothetical protein